MAMALVLSTYAIGPVELFYGNSRRIVNGHRPKMGFGSGDKQEILQGLV